MIFVILGSQKFQFNRLLIKIDELIEKNKITNEIFAQTGYSDYRPKNYKYKNFLDKCEFDAMICKSKIVITHAGTGAIINSIKRNKKVIAVPRLKLYKEHVDNHQVDIIEQFESMNFILGIKDVEDLEEALFKIESAEFKQYKSNTNNIINIIDNFIKDVYKN